MYFLNEKKEKVINKSKMLCYYDE